MSDGALQDAPARKILIALFLTLGGLYVLFIFRQTRDLFFEAQFLHIPFLNDLVSRQFKLADIFTVYYEHLFPGYNLFLLINYRLFHVWGGFDGVVSACIILLTACAVIFYLFDKMPGSAWERLGMAACLAFILTSPVNNPMWGMALASLFGTLLLVWASARIERAYNRGSGDIIVCLIIPIAIVLFCGGYGAGFVAAIVAMSAVYLYLGNRFSLYPVAWIAISILSLVVYVVIVSHYGNLSSHRPSFGRVVDIARFAVLLLGAGVLGRAEADASGTFALHYACGTVLLAAVAVFGFFLIRRIWRRNIRPGDIFLTGLLAYSLTNIAMVAAFRVGNGAEGALGQWYMAHSKFAVVFVLAGAWDLILQRRHFLATLSNSALIVVVMCCAALAYRADFAKAPYTAAWKENLAKSAPRILADPDMAHEPDPFKTLLWRAAVVKPGVDFLYANSLWVFRHRLIIAQGLEPDRWMVAGRDVVLVCPAHSKSVSFRAFRPQPSESSVVTATYNGGQKQLRLEGDGVVRVEFPGEIAAVVISGRDTSQSLPISSARDTRALVAIVDDITCDVDGPILR